MKKKFLYILFAVLLIFSMIACKTTHVPGGGKPPTTKTITINSEPAGAKVIANGEVICASTPCTITIPLTYNKHMSGIMSPDVRARKSAEKNQTKFIFIKDGYVQGEEIYQPNVRWVGMSGDNQEFNYPDAIFHLFEKQIYINDPTIRAGEATNEVTRDNPGSTALERTIVRWYFDSEPRGARIFWRVVSSIPDEVKNTNELYLTSTPYEETRSFNILGLTYENSRDVVIEIKMTKPGYMDQVKRYNVRQAIDQQEISGFFDMVKQ